jgi:predicted glutamine amidotransferase
MCRWLAYFGDPIRPEELLYQPGRSLIEQSRRGTPGAAVNNGDGYGLGWYGLHDRPGLFRSISPAWGDANLRELSAQIRSPLFLAHVRAATGTPVQQTNCHPFRHGPWLFVHKGTLASSGASGASSCWRSTRCCSAGSRDRPIRR